jgi:hypothetical protein
MVVRTVVYDVPGHGWYPAPLDSARVAFSAAGGIPTSGVDGPRTPALEVRLLPNPVVSGAVIKALLPVRARLEVEILDVAGRRVSVLASGTAGPGRTALRWNPASEGKDVKAGVYFARLRFGNQSIAKRFVYLGGAR